MHGTAWRAMAVGMLAVVLCGNGVNAATYYVDFEGGSDANPGTAMQTPFKRCPGDAEATGLARSTALQPGDVVKFKGGVVYSGSISITSSGQSGSPIVFDGNSGDDYGEGRAIIDGSAPLADLRACRNAEEASGNPNFKHIYWAYVPKDAKWKTVNIFQDQVPLAIAQDPNPVDPVFQEDPKNFVKTEPDIPVTSASLKVRPLGKMGETGNRPLISMFDGSKDSAVIAEINSGGELEIELQADVTVQSFGITPQANYTHPREVSFVVEGRDVLRATMDHNPGKSIEQRFALPQPLTFRKLIVKFISSHPQADGTLGSWGAVQRIAAYDAAGVDVLQTERRSTLRNESYFTQTDPNFFENAFLALYAKPAAVYYKRILGYVPQRHEIQIETLGHSEIPYDKGGAFSIVNSVRHIDMPGEYALRLEAEPDGKHKLFVWPPDGTPLNLTHAKYNVGIACRASFVTLQGFWIRKQGWSDPNGIDARGKGSDLVIRNVKITGIRGSGAGIHTTLIDNLLVEGCEVADNPGHLKGLVLRNARNIVVRGCDLRRNSSTALDFYTVANGVVQDCVVTENEGMHANGLTFYVGCKDILVERNTVNQGNVALTVQDGSNMIIRNNVLEGGEGGAPAIGLWSGGPFNNIVIVNNVLRHYPGDGNNWSGAIYGGNASAEGYAIFNNIIAGLGGNVLKKADMHSNLFTSCGAALTEAQLGDNLFESDLGKIFTAPETGDYSLKSGSPAINAGVVLTSINKYDRQGVERAAYGAVDIGAYEFTGAKRNPKRNVVLSDPRTHQFTFDGYEITPAPEQTTVYKMRFKPVAGAETHSMLGLDFSGQGGGEVSTRPALGGYVYGWDNAGHWLEWTVEHASAGFHELAIEHASEMQASRQVLLNGNPVPGLEKVAFAPTGAWRAFEKQGLEVALPLQSGKNVIRFVNVAGSLNFRKLEFIPVESDKPVEP